MTASSSSFVRSRGASGRAGSPSDRGRRRLVVHEGLKTAAATVILTGVLRSCVSIWQRIRVAQDAHTMEDDVGHQNPYPGNDHERGARRRLFRQRGKSVRQRGRNAERKAITANNAPPAQSETVAASSEPSVPGEVAGSSEHQPRSEEMTASRAQPLWRRSPATTTVAAAIGLHHCLSLPS